MAPRPPHLAVIDDDSLVCELYKDLFDEEGFVSVIFAAKTVTPHDLEQATWEAIIVDPCRDLLNLDWDWLETLTAPPALQDVPIIIVTGVLAPTVPEAWQHVPIVPKPFGLDQLLRSVRAVTSHSRRKSEM